MRTIKNLLQGAPFYNAFIKRNVSQNQIVEKIGQWLFPGKRLVSDCLGVDCVSKDDGLGQMPARDMLWA